MAATRGPQVLLEGYARDVARGGAGRTMRDNIAAMDALQSAGLVADGNAVDGTSRTGGQAYDPVVAQFPHAPVPTWEIPAPLLDVNVPGGPFLPLTGGWATPVTGPLLLTPSGAMSGSTWMPGLYLQTNLSGSTTVNNISNFHQVTVHSDTMDTSGSALNLINYSGVNASFGGAAMKGFRQGFAATINLVAPTGNPSGSAYVGIVGAAQASASDNGTGLTPYTSGGAVWGANFYASTVGTCQNFGGVVGIEVNPALGSGTTAVSLVGIQVVPTSAHLVRGAIGWDIGYLLSEGPGAQGIDIGYCVGTSNGGGQWPIRADGSLFRAAIGYSGGASARHGIQLDEVSFPSFGNGPRGGAFTSNGFAVDGVGQIQCGTTYFTPTGGGLSIDAIGSVGSGTPTVAAGGSGYTVNDVLYDLYGGVYIVSAVTAGAVTAVTVRTGIYGEVHQPIYPSHSTPTNPVATTTWSNSHGGNGCTLNLTWNTTANQLSLNPSGSFTTIGGGLTVQSTLFAGAAAGTYWQLNGASGFVQLQVKGSGTGSAQLLLGPSNPFFGIYNAGGGTILTVSDTTTAGAVGTYLQIANGATGGVGVIYTAGADANRTLQLGAANDAIKLGGTRTFTANGSTSVSLTALAPAGAHATVQNWLTVTDSAGVVRYIPCF